jgi:hypothetical protein
MAERLKARGFESSFHREMITHYTVRFGATVSQKELEKALNESGETPTHVPDIRKFKPESRS